MSAARVLAGFHAVTARLRAAPHSVESIRFDARRRDGRMQQVRELAASLRRADGRRQNPKCCAN